jgi:hypothetical protein
MFVPPFTRFYPPSPLSYVQICARLEPSLARQLDGLWSPVDNAGGDSIRLHSLPPNRLCFEGHDGCLDIRQRGAPTPLLDSSGGSRIDLDVLDLRQSTHRTPNVPGQLSIVVSGGDTPGAWRMMTTVYTVTLACVTLSPMQRSRSL